MKFLKRTLAWILTMAMLLSCMPMNVIHVRAAEEEESSELVIEDTVQEETGSEAENLPALLSTSTASGTCGTNLSWDLTDGVLTITGTGAMADYYYNSNAPWYSYASKITSVVIGSGVTSIGDYAFYKCSVLASVSIPGTVKNIGEEGFAYCYALTDVTIPEGVESLEGWAFYHCEALASVSLPDSLTTISNAVFAYCYGLKSIIIPKGVSSIAGNAFSDCTSLTGFEVAAANSYYTSVNGVLYSKDMTTLVKCPAAFSGAYVIPSGVTAIGASAFSGCAGLTDVTIPDTVTSIGDYAFSDCTGLTAISMSDNVTSLGEGAFSGCTSLADVKLSDNIMYIRAWTFSRCESLKTLFLPENLYCVYDYAFSNAGISALYVPAGVGKLETANGTIYYGGTEAQWKNVTGSSSLYNTVYYNCAGSCGENVSYLFLNGTLTIYGEGDMEDFPDKVSSSTYTDYPWYSNINNITSIVVEDGVTSIGNYAFYNCTKATSVSIADSVTRIGTHAFEWCSALTALDLPDNLTEVGACAFWDCFYVTEITIPATVTSIGDYAFKYCTRLANITFEGSAPAMNVNGEVFYQVSALVRYPAGDASWTEENMVNYGTGTLNWLASDMEPHYHDSRYYKPWSATDSLPATSGYYYLTEDVVLTDDWTAPTGTTRLCLNGHTISGNYVKTIGSGATVTLEDCADTPGTIKISYGRSLFCFDVASGGTLNVYDVNIKVNSVQNLGDYTCAVSAIRNYAGTVNFYSGSISAETNALVIRGASVYGIYNSSGTTNMYGGSIYAYAESQSSDKSYNAYGIFNYQGTVNISGGTITAEAGARTDVTNKYAYAIYARSLVNLGKNPVITGEICMRDPGVIGAKVGSSAYAGAALTITSRPYSALENYNIVVRNVTDDNAGLFTLVNSAGAELTLTRMGDHLVYGTVESGMIASGSCGNNLVWTLNSDYVLAVYGTGAMYSFDGSSNVPWAAYTNYITSVVLPEGLTGIGNYAFYRCIKLKSIELPESLTSVGAYAFRYCSRLASLTLPGSVTTIGPYAFSECTALTTVTMASGTTSIGTYAFNGCTALTTVVLPDTLTTIGTYAFNGCTKLASVELPESLTTISTYAFYNCQSLSSITIPGGVTSIGNYAFYNCVALASVEFSGSLKTIGNRAFYNCDALTKAELPESVTSVGTYAFCDCDGLTAVTFPSTFPTVSSYAFSDCDNLESVQIPEGVTTTKLNVYAFYNCPKLTITYDGTMAQWMKLYMCCGKTVCSDGTLLATGYHFYITEDGTLCFVDATGSMSNYTAGSAPWYPYREIITGVCLDNYTSVGAYAFYGCTALKDINLGTVEKIGASAFEGCTALEKIYVPHDSTQQNIGAKAFYGCTALKEASIAAYGTVGENAFGGCTALTDIYIAGYSGIYGSISSTAFTGVTATVHYPPSVTGTGGSYGGTLTWTASNYGTCGYDARWTFDPDTGLLTVSGTGKVGSFSSGSYTPWTTLNTKILSVVVEDGVTVLPGYTFEYLNNAASISLPDTLTTISCSTFNDCYKLNNLVLPGSLTTITVNQFNRCTALTDIYYFGTAEEWALVSGASNIYRYDGVALSIHFLEFHEAQSATCTEDGNLAYYQFDDTSVYGEYYDQDRQLISGSVIIQATDHNYVNHICSVCGDVQLRASGTCGDGVDWKLDMLGNLTIYGSGAMYDYEWLTSTLTCSTPWYNYRTEITSMVMEDSVYYVGNYAFFGCTNLVSAVISPYVSTIGQAAFYECTSLTDVEIPFSVACIGPSAFYKTAITSVELSTNVTEIANSTFSGCSKLESVIIPETVTSIGTYAFYNCDSLTGIVIPDSVTTIGADAFWDCSNLSNVTLGSGLSDIGEEAFYMCSALTEVTIPSGVTSIGNYAFGSCTALEKVAFEGNAPTIAEKAFYADVATATYPYDNTTWTEGVKQDYGGTLTWKPYGMMGGTFSGTLEWTYDATTGTLTISGEGEMDERELIGEGAPWDAVYSDIKEVVIESGVTRISYQAFYGCSKLEKVTVAETVTAVDGQAFTNCSSLKEVIFLGDAPVFGENVFENDTVEVSYDVCSNNWTEEDHGGTITWTTFGEHTPVTDAAVAPTCTETGLTEGSHCGVCGKPIAEQEVVPANGHSMDGYECTVCGYIGGECGENVFWTLDKNTSTLTISGEGAMKNYTSHQNVPWVANYSTDISHVVVEDGVTAVGSYAFSVCSVLETVELPEGLSTIKDHAFASCWRLKTVKMPSTVTSIGTWAFESCWALEEITIPDGVTTIAANTFYGCDKLTSLVLPDSVTTIGDYAFTRCSALESITLPENLQTIGGKAFDMCSGLTEIRIPASVISIQNAPFTSCYALKGIWVDEANENYSSDASGVLFNKDKTKLIEAPCGMEGAYEVPDTVAVIGVEAFYGCQDLTAVTIPASVTTIDSNVFIGCANMSEITFLGSAPKLGSDLFNSITSTAYYPLYYGWTEEVMQDYSGIITWVAYDPCERFGHQEETLPAVDSTCTEDGLTEGIQCSLCGKAIVEQEIIPAGHTMSGNVCSSCGYMGGTCGNGVYWELDGETGTLTVYGTGAMDEFMGNYNAPWYAYREMITKVVMEEGICYVGNYAFEDCTNLESVVIPDSATYIGEGAFYGCTSLESVAIPDSVTTIGAYAFYHCDSLKEITILDGVVLFGHAFSNCTALEKVTFEGCVEMSEYAFGGCTALKEIIFEGNSSTTVADNVFTGVTAEAHYPYGNATWTEGVMRGYGGQLIWIADGVCAEGHSYVDHVCEVCGAIELRASGQCGVNLYWELDMLNQLTIFGTGSMYNWDSYTSVPWYIYRNYIETVVIEEGTTSIGNHAFYGCSKITSVTIPEGVTRLGNHAFYRCLKLTEIYIPDGATDWGESVFSDCIKLATVRLPEDLTMVGQYAFQGCTSLETIDLPDGVTYISDMAFYECGLVSIELPEGLKTIASEAFRQCTKLTAIEIPESVTNLGSMAFESCTSLVSANVPGNVTSGYGIFCNCGSLKEVTLGEGLTEIFGMMFTNCSSLEAIEIPESVWEIGASAFMGCSSLKQIELPEQLIELKDYTFSRSGLTSITIPEGVLVLGENCLDCCEDLEEIYFTGDAPVIAVHAFYDVIATAYYPAGNATWTESVMQNYGGNITWKSFCTGEHELTAAETVKATCTEEGYTSYTCANCEFICKGDIVEATGHHYIATVIAPNCMMNGYTEYTCTMGCGSAYQDNYVDMTDHSFSEWVVEVESTCIEAGEERRYCAYGCGTVESRTLPLAEHTEEISYGYPATCTGGGMTDGKYCSYCGFVLEYQMTIPAPGHEYGEWVVEVESTCIEAGEERRYCVNCNDYEARGLELAEHTEKVVPGYEAACTEDGLTDGKTCSYCGFVLEYQMTIPAPGHKYEPGEVKDPTCVDMGYTTYSCARCGDSRRDDYTAATGEHTYANDKDTTCNVCGCVRTIKVVTTPMYRLYNPNSGEHFYTGSTEERDNLKNAGWQYEGVAWNAPVYTGDPVYRVYNPNSGDHHYTMSWDEVDMLTSLGWQYEGVCWNSAAPENLPLYRLYNPNADCGSHHYTGSEEERDFLVSLGWIFEGIGWFGMLN